MLLDRFFRNIKMMLLTVCILLFIFGCGDSSNMPYEPDTPAPEEHSGKFISEHGSMTFAEGGFGRRGLGFLGGIAGKGVVGATLVSVFSGGISRFGSGFKALLNNKEKKSLAAMLIGWITGIFLYISFAGLARASAATSLAGFAGAVLSVESLGEGEGWICDGADFGFYGRDWGNWCNLSKRGNLISNAVRDRSYSGG